MCLSRLHGPPLRLVVILAAISSRTRTDDGRVFFRSGKSILNSLSILVPRGRKRREVPALASFCSILISDKSALAFYSFSLIIVSYPFITLL